MALVHTDERSSASKAELIRVALVANDGARSVWASARGRCSSMSSSWG